MKNAQRFVLAACAVFVLLAAPWRSCCRPTRNSTLPATVAAILLCWRIAYWILYYPRGKQPF